MRLLLPLALLIPALVGAWGDVAPVRPGAVTTHVAAGGLWLVTGEDHLRPGSSTIAGTVVVAAGATLVVEDARLVLSTAVACANVNGRLCVPGLTVQPGGRFIARNAVIEGDEPFPAYYPLLHVYGAAEIRDTRLERVGGLLVTGEEATATILRATLVDSSGGISVTRGARALVAESSLEKYGIVVTDAGAELRGNLVRDATIAYRVSSTLVGMRCCRLVPAVEGNVAEGGELGFFVDSMERFAITGNVVRGARFGFNVSVIPSPDSPEPGVPSLEGNRVEGALTAVTFRSSRALGNVDDPLAGTVTLVLRGNDLSGSCRGLVVDPAWGPQPVRADARWNWWGSADGPAPGPDCPGATGDVDAAPWLAAAPSP